MRGFEKLRERAIDRAASTLGERAGSDATEVVDLLDDTTLPGFLALLGRGAGSASGPSVERDFLRSVATAAAEHAEVEDLGLNAGDVESLLRGLLVERRGPQVLANEQVQDVVWKVALKALERETGIDLDEEQRRQVLALLTSGEFFADASHSVATVLHAVPGIPIALVRDVIGSPLRVARLTAAALRDLAGVPGSAHAVVADLLADGDLDQHPAVMVHTLEQLFHFATVESVADMLGQLIRPDNKSVRLAIVIYARANGVPLKESDLDVLRTTLLQAERPDLGPLLVVAGERMVDEHGGAHFKKVLARLGTATGD
jgi:hypothetical protein